jgi:hypothetical protein
MDEREREIIKAHDSACGTQLAEGSVKNLPVTLMTEHTIFLLKK